jgi:anti-sigma B factor antagonist
MNLAVTYEIRNWEAGPQAHVVTASGELDLNAAPALREQINLIVDMGEATFVDSTVIGVLVARLRALQAAGGSLTLVCRNANVLRTFEISGIERAFTIYRTLTEALAAGRIG